MAHREGIKRFLREIVIPDNTSVVDWGCGTKPIHKYIEFGTGCSYFGIDKLDHVGADKVCDFNSVVDLDQQYDIAFCMEVLEHVEKLGQALHNICKSLKQDGALYFSVPFLYPIHHEHDYWRWTDQGITLLLKKNGFEVKHIEETEDQQGWVGKAVKTCKAKHV